MEALGKTRIVVEDGKVVEVGEPATEYCPVFDKVRGIKRFTSRAAKENVKMRIEQFGLFTPHRLLKMKPFVGFGTSETFMTALRRGILDTTVTVCDGAGTVITSNPELVQGIGARISGLIETSPIPEVIRRIERAGGIVLDPHTACIDMPSGVRKAVELGYKRIGVSVATVKDAEQCRNIEEEHNVEVLIFGVHNTGMSMEEARRFVELVDVTAGCASKWIRASVDGKIKAQFGMHVPIFAITQRGVELMLERAKEVTSPIFIYEERKLPVMPSKLIPREFI
jgi:putative methanogenesis marker protein 8